MDRPHSYSSLSTLARCCQAFDYAYNHNLQDPAPDPAPHNGGAMHAAFAVLYGEGWCGAEKLPEAIEALRSAWGDFTPPLGHKKAHLTLGFAEERLRLYVERREESPTYLEEGEVVSDFSEKLQSFEWVDDEGRLVKNRGIPDLVVKVNGRFYVVDHKFPTSGWISSWFWKRFKLGLQLRKYAAMYQNLTGNFVDRGYINAVLCSENGIDPDEKWKRRKSVPNAIQEVTFSEEQIQEVHAWTRGLEAIEVTCRETGVWPRNEMACDDFGGCPFLPLCTAPSESARKALMMTRYVRKKPRGGA